MCCNSGYVYSFFLYKGKNSRRKTDVKSLVLEFSDDLPKNNDQKYILYFDNYYSSLDLSMDLVEKDVLHTCTVRKNRPTWLFQCGMQDMLDDKADSCQYTFLNWKDKLIAYSYSDSSRCNFLSNHSSTGVFTGGKSEKPNVVNDYNKHMGSVDKSDAWINAFMPFPHRKNKWTRAFFFHCYKTALVNAWIIWKELTGSLLTQKEFLLKYLYSQNLFVNDHNHSVCHTHWPQHSGKNTTNKHCKFCNTDSKTPFKCSQCRVRLHAHCFLPYHVEKNIL